MYFISGIVKKRALNQKKANIIAYRNAGNGPYYKILRPQDSEAMGLRLFSLM